ncbi:MAG: hypothetical protein IJA80_07355 [Clostridia bacterium]|nr:hypothetical protein [Clostridia bacterium]
MQSKKYKFFDTVIQVLTPEEFVDIEPYINFLSDEEPDCTVTFEYVKHLPALAENVTTDSEISFKVDGNKSMCWYRNHGKEGYFACRIFDGESYRVQVLEEHRGKLWNGVIFNLLGFEEIIAKRNGVVLHASVVLKNGKMILFTAPCGTGKSTQADLWEKYADAEIVNGDKALVSLKDGTIFAGGLPFSGSSDICRNIYAPLAAVVCLGQAKENLIRKISVREALVALLQGNYRSGITDESSQKTIDILENLCSTVPVYRLDCLPDKTAVECLEKELRL